jgi:hypothetical protein
LEWGKKTNRGSTNHPLGQLPFTMELFKYILVLVLSFSHHAFSYQISGPTSGVNVQTGERPSRQDLRNFQNSGPAFDLYIQALQLFQSANQQDLLSWYSVSGIRKSTIYRDLFCHRCRSYSTDTLFQMGGLFDLGMELVVGIRQDTAHMVPHSSQPGIVPTSLCMSRFSGTTPK